MTVTTERAHAAEAAVLYRADGVELMGEMAGSGYRIPPSLVRRADGQTIQLTPLLYATLHEIDGHRTTGEVAAAVSESTGRTVNEDNVNQLVDGSSGRSGCCACPTAPSPSRGSAARCWG